MRSAARRTHTRSLGWIDVRDRLHDAPLLADGAMGTQLLRRGAAFERSFDVLNLEAPSLVDQVHRDYVAVGADLLLTNTFCANPIHLGRWNLANSAPAINRAGVRLARSAAQAAGRDVLVAGSIGPTGERLSPTGSLTPADALAAFRVQAESLCEAGVDLIWLETFSDLAEVDLALEAVRSVTGVPVIASVTFTRDGYTVLGATPEIVVRHLAGRGVDGVGVNCSTGPLAAGRVVDRYMLALDGDQPGADRPVVAAMPNAGFPENQGARLYYPATPEYFAEAARRLATAGARVIGGCCGSTPDHVLAMREALDRWIAAGSVVQVHREPATPTDGGSASHAAVPGESSLATALAAGRFVVTVEMEPPRSADTSGLEASALLLRQAGATHLDISDIPMARLRMTGLAAATRVQAATDLETILHFPVRGRNLLRVQGDLLAAHALGVRNLFVTMGDPAAIGDYPQAFDHHDIVPTGLVRLVKEHFNAGIDSAGSSIEAPCRFVVGAATSLTPRDVDHELALLRRKVVAGADFLLTQPVFDAGTARAFFAAYAERFGPLEVPVLLGILPLASSRHANFLNNEVPGMVLPDEVLRAMASAGASAVEVGQQIAVDVAAELGDLIAGVYVIPAFRRYDRVAELIGRLGHLGDLGR